MSAEIKSMKPEGSQKARRSAARLAAVQGVYQIIAADQSARAVVEDFRVHPPGEWGEGERMVTPDPELMTAIIGGVEQRRADLEQLVSGAQKRSTGTADAPIPAPSEPLLLSVMLCGAYELLAHHEIDAPLVISEYLNVTHAFFDQGESKLVHAVLDKINKGVRDNG